MEAVVKRKDQSRSWTGFADLPRHSGGRFVYENFATAASLILKPTVCSPRK